MLLSLLKHLVKLLLKLRLELPKRNTHGLLQFVWTFIFTLLTLPGTSFTIFKLLLCLVLVWLSGLFDKFAILVFYDIFGVSFKGVSFLVLTHLKLINDYFLI